MCGTHLSAFLAIAGLCICEVQSEPVPRALPVDPAKIRPGTEIVPRAEPVALPGTEDGGSSIPRALPVLPEEAEKPGPGNEDVDGNIPNPP